MKVLVSLLFFSFFLVFVPTARRPLSPFLACSSITQVAARAGRQGPLGAPLPTCPGFPPTLAPRPAQTANPYSPGRNLFFFSLRKTLGPPPFSNHFLTPPSNLWPPFPLVFFWMGVFHLVQVTPPPLTGYGRGLMALLPSPPPTKGCATPPSNWPLILKSSLHPPPTLFSLRKPAPTCFFISP